MTDVAVIDTRDITITPVFKYMDIENIPKSETAGRAVMETREMVEIRFAGTKNYVPCVPVDSFSRREGNRIITHAERWPDAYANFKLGNPQEANGTPLEMLRDQGITPETISLCRALKIYSIEALHHLEGDALKSLGTHQNALKQAARTFMAERSNSVDLSREIDDLRAQLNALKSGAVPLEQSTPEQIDQAMAEADASLADLTDSDLKDEIAKITGSRPKGNPSRATLEASLNELLEAA